MVIPSQSAYLGTATYLRCTLDTNASPIIVPFLMGHFRPLLSSNILPFQNVAKDKKYSKNLRAAGIWTADFHCWKRPLCQLCYIHWKFWPQSFINDLFTFATNEAIFCSPWRFICARRTRWPPRKGWSRFRRSTISGKWSSSSQCGRAPPSNRGQWKPF